MTATSPTIRRCEGEVQVWWEGEVWWEGRRVGGLRDANLLVSPEPTLQLLASQLISKP